MSTSRLKLDCEIVGKARPRFTTVGGAARAYAPKKSREFEGMVCREYIKQGGTYHEGAVAVTVAYKRPKPPSKAGKEPEWDLVKPDLDNVVKAVLDGLNGVAYEDDKCVVLLTAFKRPRAKGQKEQLLVTVSDAKPGLWDWMERAWLHCITSTMR